MNENELNNNFNNGIKGSNIRNQYNPYLYENWAYNNYNNNPNINDNNNPYNMYEKIVKLVLID